MPAALAACHWSPHCFITLSALAGNQPRANPNAINAAAPKPPNDLSIRLPPQRNAEARLTGEESPRQSRVRRRQRIPVTARNGAGTKGASGNYARTSEQTSPNGLRPPINWSGRDKRG